MTFFNFYRRGTVSEISAKNLLKMHGWVKISPLKCIVKHKNNCFSKIAQQKWPKLKFLAATYIKKNLAVVGRLALHRPEPVLKTWGDGSLVKVKTHGGSDRIGARDAFASKTEDAREFKFKRRYKITQFIQL